MPKSVKFLSRAFSLGFISVLSSLAPLKAAEEIFLLYGPVQLSLKVESLRMFAKDGTINTNLRPYLGNTTPEQRLEFREALTTKSDISPVLLSRFFNSRFGEEILTFLGELIDIQGGRNGKYAIRAALVQAAFSPEGLNLLTFLEKLPTNMQIDVEKVLTLSRAINIIVEVTNSFTVRMSELAAMEAKKSGDINFATVTDPRQPGPYKVEQGRITVNDTGRNRRFYIIIVKPSQLRQNNPVIVFSHGLASRPEDYVKQAEHWASYGYLVALPQHPGSDTARVQGFIGGIFRDAFDTNDFIDRPLDITYTLDELTRRNSSEFGGKLNLERVGMGGHSWGGYTALALAGAKIDLAYLENDCKRRFSYLNTSLLLQCLALNLPREDYNFRDPRIKAIFVANPVNSSIFGPKGLGMVDIPVMVGAGTYDPATPAIFEQVRSFPWFKTDNRYLALIEGQAHVDFSVLDAGITQTIESVSNITLPPPNLIDSYANSLSLAFFEVYISNNPVYRPFLSSAYSEYISRGQEFKTFLITDASTETLLKILQEYASRYRSLD